MPWLAVLYSVHLVATAVWVGTLTNLAFCAPPTEAQALWLRQRRADTLLWAALVALWATGMFQMGASANYEGFLQIHSVWATVLLVKHGLIFAVMGWQAYHSLHLLPTLRRRAWRPRGRAAPADSAIRAVRVWARVQLGLAGGILLLTAWLRAIA